MPTKTEEKRNRVNFANDFDLNGNSQPAVPNHLQDSSSASTPIASHSAGNAAVVKPTDRRSQHKFHKLFNLDHNQPLIKSFPCALVGDILFQGTFYASEHFFCFHSKFAKKRKLIQVAIREVTNLTREKTAGIIPNAIAIHTKHTRFMFASIIGRDSIFRLLNNLWDTQLSMKNTMKWEDNSPILTNTELSVEPQTPATSRNSNKVWLSASSQAGNSQVSNDGVIHDSSVDTELDSEEDDDAEENDGGVQMRCLSPDEQSNGVSSPNSTPSPDPSKLTSSPRSHSTTLCSRKAGTVSRTRNHSNSANSSSSSYFSISRCLREVWSLPRMQLCLFIAYIILIFLAFSAVVLAWRVHTYQVFLHDRIEKLDHSTFEPNCHSNDAQCNLYRLRQQTHSSRIQHVQAVMSSNIRTLNDLARRLRVAEPMETDRSTTETSMSDDKPASPPS